MQARMTDSTGRFHARKAAPHEVVP